MKKIKRRTKETSVEISFNKKTKINTGIPFFDHMLHQFIFHSGFDLKIKAKGDIKIDLHHTVEDVGIVLGFFFNKLKKKIKRRYSYSVIPMDESISKMSIDISGRGGFYHNFEMYGKIKDFDSELVIEFFKSFSLNSKYTIHLENRGDNLHHRIESIFKAFGISIKKVFNNKKLKKSTKE